jgi:hypothetical protein
MSLCHACSLPYLTLTVFLFVHGANNLDDKQAFAGYLASIGAFCLRLDMPKKGQHQCRTWNWGAETEHAEQVTVVTCNFVDASDKESS